MAYRSLVEEKTRRGHQYTNKINFMGIYQTTREKAFPLNNIASAFRVTGLILFNPEEIFGGFTMQLNTLSLLYYQAADLLNRLQKCLIILSSYERQAAILKDLLRVCIQSPSSPTKAALGQLIKGCKMAFNRGALLA